MFFVGKLLYQNDLDVVCYLGVILVDNTTILVNNELRVFMKMIPNYIF